MNPFLFKIFKYKKIAFTFSVCMANFSLFMLSHWKHFEILFVLIFFIFTAISALILSYICINKVQDKLSQQWIYQIFIYGLLLLLFLLLNKYRDVLDHFALQYRHLTIFSVVFLCLFMAMNLSYVVSCSLKMLKLGYLKITKK